MASGDFEHDPKKSATRTHAARWRVIPDNTIPAHEELGNVSAVASFSVALKMRAARSARRTDWSALDDQPFLVFFCLTIASQGVRRP
jgi:hypothetical protein